MGSVGGKVVGSVDTEDDDMVDSTGNDKSGGALSGNDTGNNNNGGAVFGNGTGGKIRAVADA